MHHFLLMPTTSEEKVKCVHCEKILQKKKLKDLREKNHGEDVKVDPVFISSSELRNITPPRIAKVIEESLP